MMAHGRYIAEIEYDPEAESFYGRTVNVKPGGFDFWGTSVDELHREFAESARVFEEVAAERGIEYQITPAKGSRASAGARRMGAVRSAAKAAAARANGAKGGRPPKNAGPAKGAKKRANTPAR